MSYKTFLDDIQTNKIKQQNETFYIRKQPQILQDTLQI
jgi:hypothetical protein